MKRLAVVLVVLLFLMSCVACASSEKTQSSDEPSSIDSNISDISQDISSEDEEKPQEEIEVNNDGYCLVVKLKSSNISINSTDDFSQYTVGYVTDTDSEKYANFYDFEEIGAYNSGHDLHSGMVGGATELGIINNASYEANTDDYDIVWDFTKNQ